MTKMLLISAFLCHFLTVSCAEDLKMELQANRDILKVAPERLKPQQVHISLGNTATDMNIMWATQATDVSKIEYHKGDRKDTVTVTGETIKLETSNEDGAQYLHRVTLHDLVPETKYYYHVRGESSDSLSAQFSFTVPAAAYGKQHTFMVYGDLGTETSNIEFLLQEAMNEKYEGVFHVGDIAYDLDRGQGQIGDKFLRKIERVAARKPYMTAPGDHERFNEYLHYRSRFSMPNLPWPMPSNKLWYSIDIGPIHFIIYSTEVFFDDMQNVDEMLNWLKSDLVKANSQRSLRPWIIAMGHKPMYCSVDSSDEDCRADRSIVRSYLEDMFYTGGVDLIISGHQHYYERTWPVYKKKATGYNYRDPAAPVHITIGTLGSAYIADKSTNTGGQWSAFVLSEKGRESFGVLKVYNATHLNWQVLECTNNKLVDSIWIVQLFHRPFNQVLLPNPLGMMGEKWMNDDDEEESSFGLESFLGLNGMHYGDDYQTKFTVLIFVFIICIIGLIARKKVLSLIRICCFKQEPCNKIKAACNNGSPPV